MTENYIKTLDKEFLSTTYNINCIIEDDYIYFSTQYKEAGDNIFDEIYDMFCNKLSVKITSFIIEFLLKYKTDFNVVLDKDIDNRLKNDIMDYFDDDILNKDFYFYNNDKDRLFIKILMESYGKIRASYETVINNVFSKVEDNFKVIKELNFKHSYFRVLRMIILLLLKLNTFGNNKTFKPKLSQLGLINLEYLNNNERLRT